MRSQSVILICIVTFISFVENMLCAFWLSFICPVACTRYLPLLCYSHPSDCGSSQLSPPARLSHYAGRRGWFIVYLLFAYVCICCLRMFVFVVCLCLYLYCSYLCTVHNQNVGILRAKCTVICGHW